MLREEASREEKVGQQASVVPAVDAHQGHGRDPRTPDNDGVAARPQQFRQVENLLIEKDSVIEDLRETVAILQMKVQKLEQLLRLKDTKIEQLVQGKARNYGSEGY